MEFSGLELETWGAYEFFEKPRVDFEFRARNEGLELLNFIFRGVLDLDEIEQIGSGSMTLSGNIRGSFEDSLPVISVNGKFHAKVTPDSLKKIIKSYKSKKDD